MPLLEADASPALLSELSGFLRFGGSLVAAEPIPGHKPSCPLTAQGPHCGAVTLTGSREEFPGAHEPLGFLPSHRALRQQSP